MKSFYKKNLPRITASRVALVYLFIAVATYGHAYHNVTYTPRWDGDLVGDKRVWGSGVAAVFWPLYVSTVIFE